MMAPSSNVPIFLTIFLLLQFHMEKHIKNIILSLYLQIHDYYRIDERAEGYSLSMRKLRCLISILRGLKNNLYNVRVLGLYTGVRIWRTISIYLIKY